MSDTLDLLRAELRAELEAELEAERMAHRATGQSADTLAKRNGELSRALRDCADTLGAILDGVSVPSDNDTHTVLLARAAIAKAEKGE